MSRLLAIALALALSATSLTPAAAQDRGPRSRGDGSSQSADPCPNVDVGEAVRRATAGREGRFLGASVQCTTVVIRWEDPGGRVRDIRVQGRPTR